MPRKPSYGPQRTALEQTIAADARLKEAKHAALIALARLLADQLDQVDGASKTLAAAYLSVLKDVERVMAGRTPGTQGGESAKGAGAGGGTLGKLQSIAGGKA